MRYSDYVACYKLIILSTVRSVKCRSKKRPFLGNIALDVIIFITFQEIQNSESFQKTNPQRKNIVKEVLTCFTFSFF